MRHRTVRGGTAAEAVPFDDALKTASLAMADHVHFFGHLEFFRQDSVAGLEVTLTTGAAYSQFSEKTSRLDAGFLEVSRHGPPYPIGFHELDQAQLHRVVSVLGDRFALHDDTGPHLQRRYRHHLPVRSEDLRHANFSS